MVEAEEVVEEVVVEEVVVEVEEVGSANRKIPRYQPSTSYPWFKYSTWKREEQEKSDRSVCVLR